MLDCVGVAPPPRLDFNTGNTTIALCPPPPPTDIKKALDRTKAMLHLIEKKPDTTAYGAEKDLPQQSDDLNHV